MASGGYEVTNEIKDELLQSEIGSLSLTDPRRANIMEGAEGNTRRILLLGKTGSGKSSLANTMFGEEDIFKASVLAKSETNSCLSKTKTINGRSIQLIDTPGFFDTDVDSEELKSELLKCIIECLPGPHAFLLVLKIQNFTPLKEEIVNLMVKEHFSEEALKYTTVVFTHGDQLDEGVKIEDWLKENKSLKNLVDKCGGRCCVFDNKDWNKDQEDPYRNNQYHIEQLLKTIDQTVRENGGGCYSNEMLREIQEVIKKEKEKLKQSSPNIPEETLHNVAQEAVYSNFKKTLCVIGGNLLWGFLSVAAPAALLPGISLETVRSGIGGIVGWIRGTKESSQDVKNAMNKEQ